MKQSTLWIIVFLIFLLLEFVTIWLTLSKEMPIWVGFILSVVFISVLLFTGFVTVITLFTKK